MITFYNVVHVLLYLVSAYTFVNYDSVCVLCVHTSAFHLTIHPGPGSICLSDHLM